MINRKNVPFLAIKYDRSGRSGSVSQLQHDDEIRQKFIIRYGALR